MFLWTSSLAEATAWHYLASARWEPEPPQPSPGEPDGDNDDSG
jgi:hypothetical protein